MRHRVFREIANDDFAAATRDELGCERGRLTAGAEEAGIQLQGGHEDLLSLKVIKLSMRPIKKRKISAISIGWLDDSPPHAGAMAGPGRRGRCRRVCAGR